MLEHLSKLSYQTLCLILSELYADFVALVDIDNAAAIEILDYIGMVEAAMEAK